MIPSKVGKVGDGTTAEIIQRFYDRGVTPDWWKLEPFRTESAWAQAVAAIERNDPHVRGIVVLGLDAPAEELAASFRLAAAQKMVKGFAVGRTIFGAPARDWFAGRIDDATAVARMVAAYQGLCDVWDKARKGEA